MRAVHANGGGADTADNPAAPAAGPVLAVTGDPVGRLARTGAVLLGAGATLVLAAVRLRRRYTA
ncbi:hypothetical protein [Dactylosporangium sp. NPDC049140]|uniref:hypothetical protein n=1 Tax=Dactylosporangium sp. NPDC049140 TaxID=3155647 RepID=UPI0033D8BB41